ncbi:MAG: DUF3016 domain-containing protein [Methylomonas sp.]
MSKTSFKYLLLPIAVLASPQALGEVSVRFKAAEQYTDLVGGDSSRPIRDDDLLKELEKHFKELGERYLPKGDLLEISLDDIDMAGPNAPSGTPDYDDARFNRDMRPPIITLHYIWRDKDGKLKADKREEVTEQNFLIVRGSGYHTNNDPLYYEKDLLDRWFSRTFSPYE